MSTSQQTTPGEPSESVANESRGYPLTSFLSMESGSSGSTIKASKIAAKKALKELLSNSGNNKSHPKIVKSEQVFVSGRGGARRIKKPESPTSPTNADILNALLAPHYSGKQHRNTEKDDDATSFTTMLSSPMKSSSGSSASKGTKASIKSAVKQVLGGGGNDECLWELEGEFRTPYGRGGSARPASVTSHKPSDVEILRDGGSSLSVARNANGLFFFGRGRHASEDGSNYLVVGPGAGLLNASKDSLSSEHSSLKLSEMTKISIKIAVKEVLGGGGNDDGTWKHVDIFVPFFGRGGEGARGLQVLDDIFSPRPRHKRHGSYGSWSITSDDSSISFPSASSDASSVCAKSMLSDVPEDYDDWTYEDDESRFHRGEDPQFQLHLTTSHSSDTDSTPKASLHTRQSQIPGRSMNDSSSNTAGVAEEVHSPELIRFRDSLKEERRKRDAELAQAGSSQSRMKPRFVKSPRPLTPPGSISELPLPPDSPPPIPQASSSSSGGPNLPPFTFKEDYTKTPDSELASSLAQVQARIASLRIAHRSTTHRLAQEQHDLRHERQLLTQCVSDLRDEIARREKTIESLTWLVANMPEYEGMNVVVSEEGHESLDEETLALIWEAERELMGGESRALLEMEPALRESSLELPLT